MSDHVNSFGTYGQGAQRAQSEMSLESVSSSYLSELLSPRLLGLNLNEGADHNTAVSYSVRLMTPGQRSKLEAIKTSYYLSGADLSDEVARIEQDSVSLRSMARVLGLRGCSQDNVDNFTRLWLVDDSINFFFKRVLPYFEDKVRSVFVFRLVISSLTHLFSPYIFRSFSNTPKGIPSSTAASFSINCLTKKISNLTWLASITFQTSESMPKNTRNITVSNWTPRHMYSVHTITANRTGASVLFASRKRKSNGTTQTPGICPMRYARR